MEQTTQLRGDPQRSEAVSATPGREMCGNYVLIRKAEGIYAFHANMQKGSVAVAAGQQVAARAVIGWLGNSGNLHFGLLDRPDFLTGYSLLFVFTNFTLSGHVFSGDDSGALQIQPDARSVSGAYPLVGDVATLSLRRRRGRSRRNRQAGRALSSPRVATVFGLLAAPARIFAD
jgi:murein DD-endopeptidase MepM/ murein hydrolase activator NlpD